MQQLTFMCTSCNAHLVKNKILRHNCNSNQNLIPSKNLNEIIKTENVADEFENNSKNIKKFNNQKWHDVFYSILSNHETSDHMLKTIIDLLKSKRNIPRKENKFYNFINSFIATRAIPDCGKVIWEIVSSHPDFKEFELSETLSVSKAKRKMENTEDLETKKQKIEISNEESTSFSSIDILHNNDKTREWSEKAKEKLSKFETDNENLKIVINLLRKRRAIPRKLTKFINFMAHIHQTHKVANCTNIVWNIINSVEKNEILLGREINSLSTTESCPPITENVSNSVTEVNGDGMPADNSNIKLNHADMCVSRKHIQEKKSTVSQKEWHQIAIDLLTKYETSDENMKNLINCLKSRANIPRRAKKFKNFVNNIPQSRTVPNSAELLWSIVSVSSVAHSDSSNLNPDMDIDLITTVVNQGNIPMAPYGSGSITSCMQHTEILPKTSQAIAETSEQIIDISSTSSGSVEAIGDDMMIPGRDCYGSTAAADEA